MIAFLRFIAIVVWTLTCSFLIIFIATANNSRLKYCHIWGVVGLKISAVRVKLIGKLPETSPYMVFANHFGIVEILAISSLKGIRFVAKAELSKVPLLGFAMKRSGHILVRRNMGESKMHITAVRETLANGDNIAIFPEGTTNDGFELLPFKPTLLRVIEDGYRPCPITIVPMAIGYENMPYERRKSVSWTTQSILWYLWQQCRLGKCELAMKILPTIYIDKNGYTSKEITKDIEVSIRNAYKKIIS